MNVTLYAKGPPMLDSEGTVTGHSVDCIRDTTKDQAIPVYYGDKVVGSAGTFSKIGTEYFSYTADLDLAEVPEDVQRHADGLLVTAKGAMWVRGLFPQKLFFVLR